MLQQQQQTTKIHDRLNNILETIQLFTLLYRRKTTNNKNIKFT